MKRIIQLTSEQSKLYDQMKQLALAELNGKVTTTATVLTQLMRLHQITCGHFKSDDGTVQVLKNERITELTNILNEAVSLKILSFSLFFFSVNPLSDDVHFSPVASLIIFLTIPVSYTHLTLPTKRIV